MVGSVGAAQASTAQSSTAQARTVRAGTTSSPHVGGYPLAAGGSFAPLPQQRILDSRIGRLASSYLVDVSQYVPPGTMAATVDITVLAPARSGYLLSVPDLGYQRSPAATLTFQAHRTVTGMAVATLTDRDTFLLQLSSPAQVLVDLTGYFTSRATTTATGSYHAVAPHRIADSRSAWGLQPIGPGRIEPVTVAGGTVPAGVSAVMVNLVEVGATAGGYLTAYPYGQAQPHVASISPARGKTVAERAIVAVRDGKITLFNAAGTTQLVVEIVGYFAGSDGSLYHAVVDRWHGPTPRAADTRIASDPDQSLHNGVLTIDETLLDIASYDLPSFTSTIAVTSVLATVSAVSPRGFGGVAAYSTGTAQPAVSDLVYTADGPVTNLVSTCCFQQDRLHHKAHRGQRRQWLSSRRLLRRATGADGGRNVGLGAIRQYCRASLHRVRFGAKSHRPGPSHRIRLRRRPIHVPDPAGPHRVVVGLRLAGQRSEP